MTQRAFTSIAVLFSLAACGPELAVEPEVATRKDAELTAYTTQTDTFDELSSAGSGAYAQVFDSDPKIEVRINHNGAAVTEKLLPELIDPSFSLGTLDVASGWLPSILAGAFQQCHVIPPSDRWELKLKNIQITPALDSNDIALEFKHGKQVEADLDLDDFRMTFEIEFLSEADRTGFWCNNLGSDYRAATTVTIDGLTGSFAATLDVPSSGSVRLASIDELEALPGTVSVSSSFLTTVAQWGLGLADLFGTGCGATLNACVDKMVADELKHNSTLKNELKNAINASLGPIAQLEGRFNAGPAQVDYAVALHDVTTSDSKDRLRTLWDVDFSSDRPNASCAAGLSRSSFMTPLNTQTTNDFDVLVPYRKITDLLYTIAKTGDLCAPFRWSGIDVEVKPAGAFRITPVFLSLFKVSLPVQVAARLGANATSAISATLEISLVLTPTCDGMVLTPLGVTLADATGTLRYQAPGGSAVTLSATTFINSYKDTAEDAIFDLLDPAYNVAPGALAIPGTGYTLLGRTVTWGANEVTFGIDLTTGVCN